MDHITPARALALVGPGRAGTALALALHRRGWSVRAVAGRAAHSVSTRRAAALLDDAPVATVDTAGRGCDLVILAPPDHAIAAVAASVAPSLEPGSLVVHLAGAAGLEILDALRSARPDVRLGALHPLQSLPSPERGAERLDGAWCAVEGDAEVEEIARHAGLQPFTLHSDRETRAVYHAAACVASNHVVALLGQVQRLAARAGVPFDAFLPLVRTTLENVADLGPSAALTGPVARGDVTTVAEHLAALPDDEQASYREAALQALRLTTRIDPELEALLQQVPA